MLEINVKYVIRELFLILKERTMEFHAENIRR
jgi:hypothetical protein